MFGNGVKVGMTVAKSPRSCGADLGTTIHTSCAWLTALAAIQLIGSSTATSGFDVWLMWSDYPLNTSEVPFSTIPMEFAEIDNGASDY